MHVQNARVVYYIFLVKDTTEKHQYNIHHDQPWIKDIGGLYCCLVCRHYEFWNVRQPSYMVFWGIHTWVTDEDSINSVSPNDAMWRQSTEASLIHVMACHMFGIKPLFKQIMTKYRVNHLKQFYSGIWIKTQRLSSKKIHLKNSSVKWWSCCPKSWWDNIKQVLTYYL